MEARASINMLNICYSPDGRSVLGETVREVLDTARGTQDRGHSFSQYGPTLAGK